MNVLVPALAVPLLVASAAAVFRRPVLALYAFVGGLAVHNLAMVLLYDAGVQGASLTVVAAWKEVLLATALASVGVAAARERRLPFAPGVVDGLALAFAAIVVAYAVVPQDVLGGEAGPGAIAHAARLALVPVAAYVLGRSLALGPGAVRGLATAVVLVAAAVAAFGIVELYAVSLDWWRSSGAPGWYREQLDLDYRGLSGLPENFVYNPGDERPLRRLLSSFLSPLATAWLIVVALLVLAAWRERPRWSLAAVPVLGAALALTHTRAAILALAGGLVVVALLSRRWWPAAAAVAVVAAGWVSLAVYDEIAPRERFTPAELAVQREQARRAGDVAHDPTSLDEPSIASHLRNLRDGIETAARHPQGYGLGNAGTSARRFDEPLRAGESTYTELGVQVGALGLALFLAWALVLLVALARRGADEVVAGLAAAFAAVLAIAVQTDVLGVPWLAYVLWGLAGAAVAPAPWPPRAVARARPATVEPR